MGKDFVLGGDGEEKGKEDRTSADQLGGRGENKTAAGGKGLGREANTRRMTIVTSLTKDPLRTYRKPLLPYIEGGGDIIPTRGGLGKQGWIWYRGSLTEKGKLTLK